MPEHYIDGYVKFLRKHADRSTCGMRHKWKLHWHHDRIGIVFDARDDCRFFERTYPDAFEMLFEPQRSKAACAPGGGQGSTGTSDVLANIRARLGR